jgi:hypothetical protein
VFFSFYWVVFFFFFRLRQIFTNRSAPSLTTLTPRAVVEPVETTKGNVVSKNAIHSAPSLRALPSGAVVEPVETTKSNVVMANSTTVHAQPQSFAVCNKKMRAIRALKILKEFEIVKETEWKIRI